MSFNSTQFYTLTFCGPHTKPHGVSGLRNNYHLRLYPKLAQGICAILRIICACVAFSAILDKPWHPGVLYNEQPHYQPVL